MSFTDGNIYLVYIRVIFTGTVLGATAPSLLQQGHIHDTCFVSH